ncbi:MAG: sig7 [Pseudonocardiales bacterium]|nr:sig7 [Pseudonocardiales bacterium]
MTSLDTRSDQTLEAAFAAHRGELTGYCYRMLGSAFEAEDAVQDTLVRAWRAYDSFEGRASLRSWLYRIATNVCLDMLGSRQRRARPMDLGPASRGDSPPGPTLPEVTWITPIPDNRVQGDGDPADVAMSRETIRLAFIAALQHLPPRQRAVLLLREVLRWSAAEVAELLGTSVASVNSSLQRARATMATSEVREDDPITPLDEASQRLLARYVQAFEAYDIELLTALLREDAIQSMPPYEMWLRGRDNVIAFWAGPGAACAGSRLIPVLANGCVAFGQYRPSGPNGEHEPWALQVLEFSDGQIAEFTAFLDTDALFPLFGLPMSLDGTSMAGMSSEGISPPNGVVAGDPVH